MTTANAHYRKMTSIQNSIAGVILAESGATVEVTHRSGNEWTISGLAEHVRVALAFLSSIRKVTVESTIHDDEIGETFAYVTL